MLSNVWHKLKGRKSMANNIVAQALALALVALAPASWCWLHTNSVAEALQPYEVTSQDPRLPGWNPLWIDTRAREDYDGGHIDGAVLLNEEKWDGMLADVFAIWKPDRPIVVYCSAGCEQSEKVALRLRDLGLEPVYFLRGGYEAWKDSH